MTVGINIGIVMRQSFCHAVAPSMSGRLVDLLVKASQRG